MKRISLACMLSLCAMLAMAERKVEMLPFGDMETWAVRYIKESSIIGGQTRILYALAPVDTIRQNKPFIYGKNGNPWSVSNAYAKVSGIEKGSGTTKPEYRDAEHGYCARMDVELVEVTALGFIDLKVLVNGTIFTGKTIEPIRTAKDPYQNIDFGVPFTRRPSALMFDYKCIVSPEESITIAKGIGKPKQVAGHDVCQAYMFLQKRWEDDNGNIYALRVGTAYEQYTKDQPTWVNDHEVKVHYGDISAEPFYRDYMGFGQSCRAMNSKGQIVPIQEVGWGHVDDEPTHMIIMLTSGSYEAFVGRAGNVFWVDNVRLVYE